MCESSEKSQVNNQASETWANVQQNIQNSGQLKRTEDSWEEQCRDFHAIAE